MTDVAKATCKQGHPYPESQRPGRSDCGVCHREQERARQRAKGVRPQSRDTCPQGHAYPENKRSTGHGCAVCHREAEAARRRRDLETSRRRAREYAREHQAEARERGQLWRDRNREHFRAQARLTQRLRKASRTPEGDAYIAILANDPCSYCGAPAEHIDHIVPVSRGGTNHWTNLTAACARCNQSKHARSLLEFMLYRLET